MAADGGEDPITPGHPRPERLLLGLRALGTQVRSSSGWESAVSPGEATSFLQGARPCRGVSAGRPSELREEARGEEPSRKGARGRRGGTAAG